MHREIPVYKAEASDGLSDAIKAQENRVIAGLCPVVLEDRVPTGILKQSLSQNDFSAYSENSDQFDLKYIYSILSTTGWNRNDDVFDRLEMWSARNTAEDKPFNKGHNPNEIIGHITGNFVVDENYELIDTNSDFDSLPEKFHIVTSAVIYKHVSSRDEKLTESTEELITQISAGKWFVSMEALFSNFDYAVIAANGDERVIQRNEDTAFLSKHLRSYGGAGEYNGMKLGRVMRNLTFSGKGLVENPGNPESIIFKEEDNFIFKGAANYTPEISLLVTSSNSKGDSSMSDNNEQVRSLQAQVETLEARLKELDEEKVQAEISAFEKACADKDAEINELTEKLEAAKEALEASKKGSEELEAAKAEGDSQIAELKEKLDAIAAENLKTDRVSALVDKGVDKAEAESLVETFAGITDEQFETLVLKLTEAPHWPGHKDEDDKKKKDKKDEDADAGGMKKKYAEMAEEAEAEADLEEAVEAAEESEDAEVLDNAESQDEAALAAQAEENSEAVVASLNEYFDEVLSGPTNKS